MSNLLEKIKAGVKNDKLINFPGLDVEVKIKVPTCQDSSDARLAADKIYEGFSIGVHNADDYDFEKTVQLLYRCIIDPETNKPLFRNITEFRHSLTPEIIDYFDSELFSFQQDVSPNPNNMSDEEFDTLLERVKKNVKEELGNISSLHTAKRLIVTLANQRKN